MSDEEYVQPAIDIHLTTPMDIAGERKPDETPIESSPDALRDASEPLVEAPPEPDVVAYKDSETGRPTDPNKTLTAEQAAKHLAGYRNEIADAKEAQSEQLTAEVIDNIRNNAANPDLQPPAPPVETQQQPAQPQAQPQAEQQLPDGIDPELAREVSERSPKFRAALQKEVEQIHTAQRAYVDGLAQNAEVAALALFSDFPPLRGIPASQLPGALQVLSQQDPATYVEIKARIDAVNTLYTASQQARAAQHEQAQKHYQREFAEFARAEDRKAEQMMPELANKESSKRLSEAAITTLRNVGFSDQDLHRAYHGEASLSLRDARAQVILAKAAMYDLAQAGAKTALQRPIPPVMRPGTAGSRGDEYSRNELTELNQRLRQSGSVKDAARLLMARRSNKG